MTPDEFRLVWESKLEQSPEYQASKRKKLTPDQKARLIARLEKGNGA